MVAVNILRGKVTIGLPPQFNNTQSVWYYILLPRRIDTTDTKTSRKS